MPKVLVVGDWTWSWYQEASARGFEQEGCTAIPFRFFPYFFTWDAGHSEPAYRSFWLRLQGKLGQGPAIWRLNADLIETARREQPDVVLLYNATPVLASTVRRLKEAAPNALIAQYCNDDPFGIRASPDLFRHIKAAIPFCDFHFVYRQQNIGEFRDAGAKHVELLRAYFIPGEDYRVEVGTGDSRFRNDVVFAGHFERDGRVAALEALARAGLTPAVFGGSWARAKLSPDSPLRRRPPEPPVTGDGYRKAVSGAKIALCFLSRINRDTYTRRSFQIPAMQTFQLSEYTDDLASLFREGEEIEFFRSTGELVDKARYYLTHDAARERIAAGGHRRVWRDGHHVQARMKQVLDALGVRPRGAATVAHG